MARLRCWIRGHTWTILSVDRRGTSSIEWWRCTSCPAVVPIPRNSSVLDLTPPDAGGILGGIR